MSARAWRIYLAVVLYLLLPLEGLWSNLAYDLIGLSSVAAILIAVRRHRPARPLLWWCFAIGQLLFVSGDVLYEVVDLVLHQSPFPSIADGFYLAGYPVLATGLLILIRGRLSGRDRAGLIDLLALRRVPARFFGVFMSVNPVLAALVGLLILGQSLGWAEWLAIAAIVSASTVSVLTADRSPARVRRQRRSVAVPVAVHPSASD